MNRPVRAPGLRPVGRVLRPGGTGSWPPCGPVRSAFGFAAFLALILCGCGRSAPEGRAPAIAATTSYLEAAAHDLLGDHTGVLRLAEPGTCPGHFDIRPSQAMALERCQLLLRFDFQKSLDDRLVRTGAHGPRVGEIVLRSGMGCPDSYLTACRQTAEHLVAVDLLPRTNADLRLQAIDVRLSALSLEATRRVTEAGLEGAPVISSTHQRDFCTWLGLRVVAAFRAADTASIAEIESAIEAGRLGEVRLVIANLPEGRRTADALATRLGGRVVVFENFPALREDRVSFDEMVTRNLLTLLQAGITRTGS